MDGGSLGIKSRDELQAHMSVFVNTHTHTMWLQIIKNEQTQNITIGLKMSQRLAMRVWGTELDTQK